MAGKRNPERSRPQKQQSWRSDENNYRRYLAEWGGTPLSELTKSFFQTLHVSLGTTAGPVSANRVRSLLSTIFSVAIKNDQWSAANPLTLVERFPEQAKTRFLHADELPTLFRELDADKNQGFADFARLALFAGARRSNVLAMRTSLCTTCGER